MPSEHSASLVMRSSTKPRTLVITWVLAFVLAIYLAENLWVDGWIRSKFPNIPELVPAPLTSFWFVVFGFGGICCVVLVVCQVLVSLHRRISLRTKICTGLAVVGACVLWGVWFSSTSGTPAAAAGAQSTKHSVRLNWKASNSPVVGYNVYRSTIDGRGYVKINSRIVEGLSYVDQTVESGKTYYYVTRSVDGKGRESGDSAEVVARVP